MNQTYLSSISLGLLSLGFFGGMSLENDIATSLTSAQSQRCALAVAVAEEPAMYKV